jgi:dimethylamine/trimethylamine dehydrogenase
MSGAVGSPQNDLGAGEFRRARQFEQFDMSKNLDKDALVIGAGLVGMACARVLGERRFRNVHLVDAGDTVGGAMRSMSSLPGLTEWQRFVDSRRAELDELRNVRVILRTRLGVQDVLDYGASVVVVATGSSWTDAGIAGCTESAIKGTDPSLDHVLTPEQVMNGVMVGNKVVVYDTDGYFIGMGISEKLLLEGHDVTYVTPFRKVASFMEATLDAPGRNRKLRALGLKSLLEHHVVSVERGMVRVARHRGSTKLLHNDSIVLVTPRLSQGTLWDQLQKQRDSLEAAGIWDVYRIGYGQAPQVAAEAMFPEIRAAQGTDVESPTVWLPLIRDRCVSGFPEEEHVVDAPALHGGLDRVNHNALRDHSDGVGRGHHDGGDHSL